MAVSSLVFLAQVLEALLCCKLQLRDLKQVDPTVRGLAVCPWAWL